MSNKCKHTHGILTLLSNAKLHPIEKGKSIVPNWALKIVADSLPEETIKQQAPAEGLVKKLEALSVIRHGLLPAGQTIAMVKEYIAAIEGVGK